MGRGLFIYYGKRNYYVLINCIRHCVRGEFIQNYFKIFSFLSIWDKNLRSHTGWPLAKPLWIRPWHLSYRKRPVAISDTTKEKSTWNPYPSRNIPCSFISSCFFYNLTYVTAKQLALSRWTNLAITHQGRLTMPSQKRKIRIFLSFFFSLRAKKIIHRFLS